MSVDQILEIYESLTPDEQDQFFKHLRELRERRIWQVPSENLAKINDVFAPVQAEAAELSEEEVDADIAEALSEVRGEAANRRN
jgi:uncharacterized protein YhaN